MKKTMLALMATVGLAFVAKADDPAENIYEGSTAFETAAFTAAAETEDKVLPALDEGETGSSSGGYEFWVGSTGDSKVASGGSGSTVAYYAEGAHNLYASLDTGSDVLLRKAVSGDNTVDFGEIYFDTMVQFTASDDDVTPEAGDKLIVWMKATGAEGDPEEPGYVEATTNLMITAGALNPLSFKLNGTNNYTVAGTYEAGVWYRLTVKTVWNISGNSELDEAGCPGFKVYVNGNPVALKEGSPASYDGCFASLVDREASTSLTGIGFKGTGAVDDIAMTVEDPIPEVETTFPMTLTVEGEVNYTDKALYVQDDVLTNEFTSGVAVDVLKETKTITIVVGVFDDYEVTDFTKGDAYVNIDEDPCTYYTKDIAVTSEMQTEGYALTITVVQSGEEATDISTAVVVLSADSIKVGEACPTVTSVTVSEVPLELGTDYTVAYPDVSTEGEKTITLTGTGKYTGTATATFTVTAAEPTTVVTPTAAEIASGEITVTPGTTTAIKVGTYEVPISAFNVVGTTATVAAPVVADSAAEEDDAFVIDDDSVTINVNPVAGLYYGVDKKTDLGTLARPATLTQFTGENKAAIFTVTKPEGTAAFFKVYVDVKE